MGVVLGGTFSLDSTKHGVRDRQRGEGVKVDSILVVAAFKPEAQASLKLGSVVAEVAQANGAQVNQLGVPSQAPPHFPRVMIGMQNSMLQVAEDRVQLSVTLPDHIAESLDEVLALTHREIERVLKPALDQPWMTEAWAGVVLNLSFPAHGLSMTQAATQAASSLVNLEWSKDHLETFQLQIGKKVDGYFRTVTISGYEKRDISIELEVSEKSGSKRIEVTEENSKVTESGIGVVLDINNRASSPRPLNSVGLFDVLKVAREAVGQLPIDLNLGEVLR